MTSGTLPLGILGKLLFLDSSEVSAQGNIKLEGYSDGVAQKASEEFKKLTDGQRKDFLFFDGNVQGFRILTKLGLAKDDYSYNLCLATLATIIKYPYSSKEGNKKNEGIACKKFGFFQSERNKYEEIIEELGLKIGQRHPLVFLLEAADDIAYSVSDLEDGYKLGCITIENIESINNLLPEEDRIYPEEKVSSIDDDIFVQSVRIKAQSKMLRDCTKAFIDNYSRIMDGSFDEELIYKSDSKELREKCKELGVKNFEDKRVLRRELVGDKVITYFLNLFIGAIFSKELRTPGSKEAKLLRLIPENYLGQDLKKELSEPQDTMVFYHAFMAVVDFISGMTDTYALSLYQELTGQIIS